MVITYRIQADSKNSVSRTSNRWYVYGGKVGSTLWECTLERTGKVFALHVCGHAVSERVLLHLQVIMDVMRTAPYNVTRKFEMELLNG